jgi:hypothetical protein
MEAAFMVVGELVRVQTVGLVKVVPHLELVEMAGRVHFTL